MADIYVGRILRVDLSTGTMTEERVDPQILREFMGGSGMGIRMLSIAKFHPVSSHWIPITV